MKILLSGGGTLGSVTPLIALAQEYRKINTDANFVWVGTAHGPERPVVEQADIRFVPISSGKLRRYFSFKNFIDPFKVLIAFFQSIILLKKEKPVLLISAGGFVSVPLHRAAYYLGIPAWVHQQDIVPGLANIMMAKTAKKVTVASRLSLPYFKGHAEIIGNFCRDLKKADKNEAKKTFNIGDDEPVVLVMGGGTGAEKVNQLTAEAIHFWPAYWHVIHSTGLDRDFNISEEVKQNRPDYLVYKFLGPEMADAYACADVVISRAGFGAITELASLGKPSVILAIPESQQTANAQFLADGNAAVILDERKISGRELAEAVTNLMNDNKKRQELGENIHRILPIVSGGKIAEIISTFCHSRAGGNPLSAS